MMILCDIGNTSIDVWMDGRHEKQFLNNFSPDNYDGIIYYICVNSTVGSLLKSYDNWLNLEQWINRNSYYATMGIDRIIACEAIVTGVIVDAGSAITVDVMEDGEYKGGFITIGLKSMQKALKQLSPALDTPFNFEVDLTIMAKNTPDAITIGYFAPLIRSIQDMALPVYLTGGDSDYLARWLNGAAVDKTLIFQGMKKIIEKEGLLC